MKEWLDSRYFRRVLKQLPGNDVRVLDIGGGTGWLLDQVKDCDSRVTTTQVVDIDARAQAGAEAAGHGFFAGGIESYVTDDQFDMILMNLVRTKKDSKDFSTALVLKWNLFTSKDYIQSSNKPFIAAGKLWIQTIAGQYLVISLPPRVH